MWSPLFDDDVVESFIFLCPHSSAKEPHGSTPQNKPRTRYLTLLLLIDLNIWHPTRTWCGSSQSTWSHSTHTTAHTTFYAHNVTHTTAPHRWTNMNNVMRVWCVLGGQGHWAGRGVRDNLCGSATVAGHGGRSSGYRPLVRLAAFQVSYFGDCVSPSWTRIIPIKWETVSTRQAACKVFGCL